MKKLITLSLLSILFFACSRDEAEIITDYTSNWDSQEFNYYPHKNLEIRKNGTATLTTEHTPTFSDNISGRFTITDNSVLEINNVKMRINDPPALDTLDNRMWMQIEGVWYKKN